MFGDKFISQLPLTNLYYQCSLSFRHWRIRYINAFRLEFELNIRMQSYLRITEFEPACDMNCGNRMSLKIIENLQQLKSESSWSFKATLSFRLYNPTRPERCIVTIASLDQWLATIEKHRHQWLADWKTIEKPLVPMVEQVPFHQWQWSP